MTEQITLAFDERKLKKFRKAYNNAIARNIKIFEFDGHKFMTEYAKYMIEYVDFNLKNTRQ